MRNGGLSRLKTRLVVALAALALWASCKDINSLDEGGAPLSGGVADTISIVIEDFAFKAPNGTDTLSISLGQTIRFVNRGATPHTATSTSQPAGDGGFESGRLSTGQEYYWTPDREGLYVYRCDFHPIGMNGAAIAVGATEIPPDTARVPPDTSGTGNDTTQAVSDTIFVDIVNFSFRGPDGTSRIQAEPGQTIRFTNRDDADHTVTSTGSPTGAAGFDSGNLAPGQTFHWTAPQAGDWSFVCEYHSEMVGSIAVSDPGGGDGGGDDDDPALVIIEIIDGGFVGPNGDGHVTLTLGQTVRWVNVGSSVHTASARSAPDGALEFDSGELAPGASFSFTPDRAGVWLYRCDEHSAEPEGSITVR